MWRAIHASAYEQGIGVAFTQAAIIMHVLFRAVGINMPNYCLERSHEEQANSAVEEQRAIPWTFDYGYKSMDTTSIALYQNQSSGNITHVTIKLLELKKTHGNNILYLIKQPVDWI